jgi:DNA-binding transcriptional MerR regulator
MYNIETLAKMTGLTRRTVRYYVQRGLLDQPEGGGRGSYYTDRHLSTIEKIKKWSEQGVPLIHIKAMLEGKEIPVHVDVSTGVQVESCERCTIADGIELHFRPGRLSFEDLLDIKPCIADRSRRKEHEH